MNRLYIIFLLSVASLGTSAQNYYASFKKMDVKKDSVKITELLTDWEKSNPNDPEFYVCAFNYYFLKSQKEVISLEKKLARKKNLHLQTVPEN